MIAIIGMACRFPGAPGVEAYWELLRSGREAIRRFSAEELRAAGIAPTLIADPLYVPARGMLDDVSLFDAGFFRVTPREASLLDPQQRIWLECAWEALEDAGYHGATCGKSVGVFAGCRMSTYLLHALCTDRRQVERLAAMEDAEAQQILLCNDKDFLATRTSYLLDLRGPSLTVQTACSSSLVAVAQACQSLLSYQSDLCLAGGASVVVPSVQGYRYQAGGTASPDGHCRAFDARAKGTVFGDGVGAVVLKRLDEAVADRDAIYAVIRGFAVNNDGMGKMSIAAPSVDGQAEVVAVAQAVGGVEPHSVSYVEAHGTGTPVGDPIEVAALTRAFRRGTDATGFCGLGSVKTNIGHADAAAGVAGLIKTALALQRREIPPTLHFDAPNPAMDLERSPFYVVRRLTPWERNGTPRRAGVTSLGMGGTNCHVVLEEAPDTDLPVLVTDRPRHLLALSARSGEELRALADRYAAHLAARPSVSLADLCFTASTGRASFHHRAAFAAATVGELREQLATFASSVPGDAVESADRPSIAFLFTGQGAHYSGMARDLYTTQPVFRDALDRCDRILGPRLGRSLTDTLYHADDENLLARADYAQPALFAVQFALAELWRSWGVVPDVVLGHSIGELAAACVAGVFSLEDGLQLVAERGRLMHELPAPGSMAAALGDLDRVARLVEAAGGVVSLAAVNGPGHVVLSGPDHALEAVLAELRAAGIEIRRLAVSHAFHSPVMDPMLPAFERAAAAVQFARPRIDFVSTVSGDQVGDEIAEPAYWRDQIRRTVRFADAFAALERRAPTLLVEIGPHPVLLGMARLCSARSPATMVPSLSRRRPDWEAILDGLGLLYGYGVAVDWRGFDAPYPRRRLHLPTYPFRRRRHWVEPAGAPRLLERQPALRASSEIRYEARLSSRIIPHLEDHRLFGVMIVAASSSIALILAAAEDALGDGGRVLEEITFLRPLVVPDDGERVMRVILQPVGKEPDTYQVQVVSCADGADAGSPDTWSPDTWTLHVTARLRRSDDLTAAETGPDDQHLVGEAVVSGREFYTETWGPGADTGPSFRWIETIRRSGREAVAQAAQPELREATAPYPLPPGAIEACFQTLFYAGAFESRADAEEGAVYVPFTIERFAFRGRFAASRLWCHAQAREGEAAGAAARSGATRLLDDAGRIVAEISGFEVRRMRRDALRGGGAGRDGLLYRVAWEPRALGSDKTALSGDWLILTRGNGAGSSIAAALGRRGARCAVVNCPSGGAPYSLDGEDGLRLLRGVLYLADPDEPTPETACAELLRLLQDMAAMRAPPRFWLVTRGTQAVLPEDALPGARQAVLWGLCRVAGRECPALQPACVDLEGDAAELEQLVDEIEAGAEGEREVALRQGTRYVARLLPYRGPDGAAPVVSVREDLTYLVTDGCSSQGQAVAQWLVRNGARHLILTASTADSAAAPHPKGAHVRIVTTDSLPPEEAVKRLRDAWAPMPRLGGIVHLDLPMDDGIMARQTPERFRAVLASSALGWALHSETRALALDFFVCFSSSAAVLGTPGQSSYAAAGASLDALALYRRRHGLPGLSVNWGPWAEVGKAAGLTPQLRQRLHQQGWEPLATARALQVLGRLLRSSVAHVAVLPLDWKAFRAAQPPGESFPLLERVAGTGGGASRVLSHSGATSGTKDAFVLYLRQRTADALGVPWEEIDEGAALLDLGLDSMSAQVLANRISTDVGKEVSLAAIIRAPTLRALADALRGPS